MISMLLLSPPTSPFAPAVRIEAGGEFIDVDMAHAAPLYEDIDGDGLKELLVGQFKDGKIRLYKNHGTNTQPVFKDFTWLQAGGQDISVSCG